MIKKILVLGASGMLGKPVVEQLVKDGYQVRVLLRDPQKAEGMFPESVEVFKGDVSNLEDLQKAMKGCEGVSISVGGSVDRLSVENVCKLAPELGISQITYISGATVAEKNRYFPMVAQKLDAEKALRNSGIAWTVFCPTWPMDQISRFARGGKPFMLGKQPNPLHFFASSDLGKMVSQAYANPEALNKRFPVFGPQALSMQQALEIYIKKFFPQSKVSSMPIWLAKLMARLTKNEMMAFAANLMGYFEKTPETGDPTEANRLFGKNETTLDEWMSILETA